MTTRADRTMQGNIARWLTKRYKDAKESVREAVKAKNWGEAAKRTGHVEAYEWMLLHLDSVANGHHRE